MSGRPCQLLHLSMFSPWLLILVKGEITDDDVIESLAMFQRISSQAFDSSTATSVLNQSSEHKAGGWNPKAARRAGEQTRVSEFSSCQLLLSSLTDDVVVVSLGVTWTTLSQMRSPASPLQMYLQHINLKAKAASKSRTEHTSVHKA